MLEYPPVWIALKVVEFHFITPIGDLESSLEYGILSNMGVAQLEHSSIAAEVIQDRRSAKRVPGGRPLHEYATSPLGLHVVRGTCVQRQHCGLALKVAATGGVAAASRSVWKCNHPAAELFPSWHLFVRRDPLVSHDRVDPAREVLSAESTRVIFQRANEVVEDSC